MSRPVRIGVAVVWEAARWSFWSDQAALVPAAYHRAIIRAGGVDMPLVPDPRVTARPELVLDVVDGLLLIGGLDVHPGGYGAATQDGLESTSAERDEFEIALARWAMERELPLLGICRGMQIMNVARGGSLSQDLGPELNSVHRPRLGSFEGTEHEIEVVPGSLAAAAGGDAGRHLVHSHHHQAIATLGDDLIVSAVSDDGIVEAVELRGHRFALGVQWHPEADERSQVVGALVRAARSTSGAT